jgi:hypothetical protein
VQREKTDPSGVCKSLIRGSKWKWLGGWVVGTILYFLPSAIQLACVNCPIFEVKNNIGKKIVFWRDNNNFFVLFYIRTS